MTTMPLIHQMLRGEMRQYIIEKVKAPFMKAIVQLAKRYPEPTRENLLHPNSHRLMDLRDKFNRYEANHSRKALFDAAWKVLIDEYEHDSYYRYRFDWILEELVDSGWKPRPDGHPTICWGEPRPYGGKVTLK